MEKPDVYIVARFLEILHRNGPDMKRTNIQMLLGLRYPRFREYLDWLVSRGLVAQEGSEDEKPLVRLTPKGIDSYQKLVDLIKETFDVANI